MSRAEALLDSNVLVAMIAEDHPHHEPSSALLGAGSERRYAVAAHSHAEAYTTLTRRGAAGPYRLTPDVASRALKQVAAVTRLVGLTPTQTLDAVRSYAAAGGMGARLYDRLIGEAAVHAGLNRIVTWNVGHMRALFPTLEILEPPAAVRR